MIFNGDLDGSATSSVNAPSKIVGKKTMVQFTCAFKEVFFGGRSDIRTLKTIINELTPQHVAILQGSGNISIADRKILSESIAETGIKSKAPDVGEAVSYWTTIEKVKLMIPQTLTSISVGVARDVETSQKASDFRCTAALIPFNSKFIEVNNKSSDGIRAAKVISKTIDTSPSDYSDEHSVSLGAISAGEVLLETIKQRLEAAGVFVEYKLGRKGGMLLCDNVVVVRKENENDVVIEGGQSVALDAARRALYDSYTIL